MKRDRSPFRFSQYVRFDGESSTEQSGRFAVHRFLSLFNPFQSGMLEKPWIGGTDT
jgi:hypothetical protein